MNKSIKLAAIIVIIIVILVALAVYYNFESSGSKYLLLKSGNTVSLEGQIDSVHYINTSYGNLPIISLKNNIKVFQDANLLDNAVYNISGFYDALYIYGNPNKEYHIGDNINVTLHFEDFKLSDKNFLWIKELGIYLEMPMAIQNAIDETSYYAGIGLIQTSATEGNHIRYEVFTRNNDTYPIGMFNITLLSIPPTSGNTVTLNSLSVNPDTIDITYEDNVLLSEAMEKMIAIMSAQYVYVSGGGGVIIDFMGSLNDGVSQNGTIEFVDSNSNGLLDDYDYFDINISPTSDDTIIDTYVFNLGNGLIYHGETDASGVKYIINWYKGPIEMITQRLALSYVSYEKNGSSIDTKIKISRIRTDDGYSINKHYLSLYIDNVSYGHASYQLSKDTISIDKNISIEYVDSNNNSLFDMNDLLIVRGIKNHSYVELKISADQTNGISISEQQEIGRIKWIAGDGYVKGI